MPTAHLFRVPMPLWLTVPACRLLISLICKIPFWSDRLTFLHPAPRMYLFSGSYAYVTADASEGKLFIIDVSDFAESPAIPVDPSVTISLNKSEYYPGDNMKVTLSTSAGTGDNSWDVYVGLIMPDNSLRFMTFDPSFSLGFDSVPARPSKPIATESMTILEITMPEGLPTGNWQWASALGKDNLSKLSNISWGAVHPARFPGSNARSYRYLEYSRNHNWELPRGGLSSYRFICGSMCAKWKRFGPYVHIKWRIFRWNHHRQRYCINGDNPHRRRCFFS
jgi:hypothetical protein